MHTDELKSNFAKIMIIGLEMIIGSGSGGDGGGHNWGHFIAGFDLKEGSAGWLGWHATASVF